MQEFALGDYHVPASKTFLVPLRELAAHDPRWEGQTGEGPLPVACVAGAGAKGRARCCRVGACELPNWGCVGWH